MEANEIIEKLGLEPLPEEGGFFRQTYKDDLRIPASALENHGSDRSCSTCIYYLLTPEEFSGLHCVKSAEIFHFYAGSPVEMIQIDQPGELKKIVLGNSLELEHQPQVIVPANTWQGTKLLGQGQWALLGCTVSPGFEFSDFVSESADSLCQKFPQHAELIRQYTHA
jgi:predicted cupin superfamily sugar epimerase